MSDEPEDTTVTEEGYDVDIDAVENEYVLARETAEELGLTEDQCP